MCVSEKGEFKPFDEAVVAHSGPSLGLHYPRSVRTSSRSSAAPAAMHYLAVTHAGGDSLRFSTAIASARGKLGDMNLDPSAVLLTDRVAIVTGAARGIGAATAMAFARFGAHVVGVDKLADELDDTFHQIREISPSARAVVGDVRESEVVDATVACALDQFGRIDILVNNAGGGFWAPFVEVSEKGQLALINENFTQVAAFVRAAVPHMDGGSIINVTSIEAHRAGPGFAVYSAMKAGVENLSKSLALELAPSNIRVNCVAPDMISTPGDEVLQAQSAALSDDRYAPQPLSESGVPDDVASVICFLASDMARFVTGASLHVDGGTFAASGWRRRHGESTYLL
jgi:NAD(P)-dependent dehydrogenase (short-subunit alcohol dehydrogenase family)